MRLVTALLAACLCLSMASVQAATSSQANSSKSSQAKGSSKAKAPATKSSSTAKGAKTTSKSTKNTSSKPATTAKKGSSSANCAKNKSAKGCTSGKAAPATKALSSPITADSLDKSSATSGDEIKARTVPDRAYAIDGQTFFHQGRRIRIEGLSSANASATGEHAKQRLQTLLDSGSISIEQIAIDDTGVASAQVRVNGRDLASQLNSGN